MTELQMVIDGIVPENAPIVSFFIVVIAVCKFSAHRFILSRSRRDMVNRSSMFIIKRGVECIRTDIDIISLLVIITGGHFDTVLYPGTGNDIDNATARFRSVQNGTAAADNFNALYGIGSDIF